MKDLTKGFPAKVIIMFAIPIMASFIFQQLYNMVDAKIVSSYVGTDAFAAVGATGVVSNTIIGFISGLTQGFAIPAANAFGAKDTPRLKRYIAGSVILTAATAVILTALSLGLIERVLILLRTTDDIMPYALSYVRIILGGIVFTAIYNFCANILRALGNSKTPLYCLITAVVLNIFLDILFVKYMSLGINGAAIATIIAQAVSAFLCLIYLTVKYRSVLPGGRDFSISGSEYLSLISSGLAMGLMSCIVNIGTVILQSAINSLGTAIVTAHTAARKLFDILTVLLYSVGIAMTTYSSQNMGAGESERVKRGVLQSVLIELILTAFLFAVCMLFGRQIIEWITSSSDPQIIEPSVMYIKISISFFFVLGPLFVLRCSLQGMGQKILPVVSSIVEMLIKILSAAFLVPLFGYKGVAFTEPVSWCVMCTVLAVAFIIELKKLRLI